MDEAVGIMTGHVVTVAKEDLDLLLVGISWGGGTVTGSRPCGDEVTVTYVNDRS